MREKKEFTVVLESFHARIVRVLCLSCLAESEIGMRQPREREVEEMEGGEGGGGGNFRIVHERDAILNGVGPTR